MDITKLTTKIRLTRSEIFQALDEFCRRQTNKICEKDRLEKVTDINEYNAIVTYTRMEGTQE